MTGEIIDLATRRRAPDALTLGCECGSQNFMLRADSLTDRAGFDVVFDHVGGELFEKSLALVRWGGRIVICGATSGFSPRIDLRQIFFRQVEILGSTMGSKAKDSSLLHDRTKPRSRAPDMMALSCPSVDMTLISSLISGLFCLTSSRKRAKRCSLPPARVTASSNARFML